MSSRMVTDAQKHVLKGPYLGAAHSCTCGASFEDHNAAYEHIRLTIDCPRCGAAPAADLVAGDLHRWTCGHWIAYDDHSAAIRTSDGKPA